MVAWPLNATLCDPIPIEDQGTRGDTDACVFTVAYSIDGLVQLAIKAAVQFQPPERP
jgi:hypothetical protein